jgi:hypothetical protein
MLLARFSLIFPDNAVKRITILPMKKQQLMLGGLFVALPFAVVTFLSGEVAPTDSPTAVEELHNTCMRGQPGMKQAHGCTELKEAQGG